MAFDSTFVFSVGVAALIFAYMASTLENKPVKVLFYCLASGLGIVLVGSNYSIQENLGANTTAISSLTTAAFIPTVTIVSLFIIYMFLSLFYNLFKPKSDRERDEEDRQSEEEAIS